MTRSSGYEGSVYGVAYNSDGTLLASAVSDGTVKVWDAKRGTLRLTLTGHTKHVRWVTFSPDGRRLASASWDKTVKLWDLADLLK
jgi:WD40 repeat protein